MYRGVYLCIFTAYSLQFLAICYCAWKVASWLHYSLYLTCIHAGTRETAFLNAIISGGIAREVARKCKEQELDSCGCDFSVDNKIEKTVTTIGGCGDNYNFGLKIAKNFTDVPLGGLNDCCSLVSLHNNEVGRMVSTYIYIAIASYNNI